MSNPMTAVLLSASLIAASTADPTYVFTTFAGAPPSLVAVQPLDHPYDVAADSAGNVFISDTFNDIRKLSPSGDLTVFAGQLGNDGSADGNGTAAQFDDPRGIVVDAAGNVFVADQNNHTIRKITGRDSISRLDSLSILLAMSTSRTNSTERFAKSRRTAT